MSIYVWYSGATDITGKVLVDALNAKGIETSGGISCITNKPDLLVCYGCKHGDPWRNSNIAGWNVLNNPVNVRNNANKLLSLNKLKDSVEVTVALPIVETENISRSMERGDITLPAVGRTKFHQGGKGFWLCLQKSDVASAVAEGAQYFQPYIPKDEEFRVHIFGGEHLFSVKKVKRTNPYDDWRTDRTEVITEKARTRGVSIDAPTLALALEYAPKGVKLPDTAIRSLHRGWVFKTVSRPKASITALAKKTAEILGLDFAAVDIMIGDDGSVYVLEANSGPGLKGQNIDKYVAAIEAKHIEVVTPPPAARRSESITPTPRRRDSRARGTSSRRTPSPRRSPDTTQTDTSDGHLRDNVRGLLRGVDVDSLDEAGKRVVRDVLGNLMDRELGI